MVIETWLLKLIPNVFGTLINLQKDAAKYLYASASLYCWKVLETVSKKLCITDLNMQYFGL